MKAIDSNLLDELIAVLENIAGSRYQGNEFEKFMRVGNPASIRRLAMILDKTWKQYELKDDHLKLPVDEFRAALTELEKFNRILDFRIKERTRELADANLQLEKLSALDPLTGIANRRHFEERLEQEFSLAKRHQYPLSCIMLDIDHFKNVNDTYGHLFGDEVLKEIGQILKLQLRLHDIYARYGGEEFVILLPQSGEYSAFYVAEKIRNVVAQQTIAKNDIKVNVTISLGVAELDFKTMTEKHSLVDAADQALYEAKRTGRNRSIIFTPGMKSDKS